MITARQQTKHRQRDPLRKRILRELRQDFAKYLVLFVLMTFSIGFISGFLVAADSMIYTYNEGFTKYNIQNGNFRTEKKMNRAQQKAVEEAGVAVSDLFYVEHDMDNGSVLRVYTDRKETDLVCLMEGELPAASDEIAIDRMYADNNAIAVGDSIAGGGQVFRVSGLVALPDYSCLFSNNNDAMFDAVKFGVAIVPQEGFDALAEEDPVQYSYAWKYPQDPADDAEEKEWADALREVLHREVTLKAFVPRYLNKAINFTGDDLGSDSVMMVVLLYIIIAILAFVFAITLSATIAREAGVIGTLRASGYTRGELVRHYLTVPILVTIVAALVGNILGYSVFKHVAAAMYYGSYSLPTYVTIWNADAFVKTTVVPLAIVLAISLLILVRRMRLSPLQFLRRDLRTRRQRRALPLPKKIPFFSRFRLRVIFQNAGNYLVVFIGILFANLLLMFGLGLPAILNRYMDNISNDLLCKYQYFLTVPADATNEDEPLASAISMALFAAEVETENESAEKFSIWSLRSVPEGSMMEEEILLYGIAPGSRYVPVSFSEDDVYISSLYADKYQLGIGDSITLKEELEETTYTFPVTGIFDYSGAIAVFMDQQKLNATFDQDKDFFCGYLSDTEITDIDAEYIGTVMDLEALTKISRQLKVSMGSMMGMVDAFAVILFVILIFLLSKLIIEKNAQSISMAKILGYTDREINRLYVRTTTIVVAISIAASLAILTVTLVILFRVMLAAMMTGWLPIEIPWTTYVKAAALGFAAYLVVALIEMRRIKKVPMDEALKVVE